MKTHVNQHEYHFGIIKILVVSSLLLLGYGIYKVFTINGNEKEFIYENSMMGNANQSINSELGDLFYTHSYNNEVMEETLPVEQWMLNPSSWRESPSFSLLAAWSEDMMEEPLLMEEWMTDLLGWEAKTIWPASVLSVESEPELAIEPWMLNDEGWDEYTGVEVTSFENEDGIKLESWMMNTTEWNVPIIPKDKLAELGWAEEEQLVLEPWMISCCTWVPEKLAEIEIYEFSKSFSEDALTLEEWMLDDMSWLITDIHSLEEYPIA
ncbi:hypothetical protein [Saccharicrinis sp. GN24d3]|uniref:hypothetical protein n=1 Tax=Saccharicrinis sp. GN24d3 TaxID=3458416 RepID=UPI00403744EF